MWENTTDTNEQEVSLNIDDLILEIGRKHVEGLIATKKLDDLKVKLNAVILKSNSLVSETSKLKESNNAFVENNKKFDEANTSLRALNREQDAKISELNTEINRLNSTINELQDTNKKLLVDKEALTFDINKKESIIIEQERVLALNIEKIKDLEVKQKNKSKAKELKK